MATVPTPAIDTTRNKATDTVATLLTPRIVVSALVGIVATAFIFRACCLQVAQPDEWMVVIRDGKQLKAGIGLRHWKRIDDTVVKFKSSLVKVPFKASQVTSEMQGVEVSGVVIWTVYRDADGPFRAYRSLEGLTPEGLEKVNNNLQELTQSIIRSQIATMTITEVLSKRDILRDAAKNTMMKLVQGWGVWLETIEVTDVRIQSQSLFSNMQSEYREQIRSKAEQLRMTTDKGIEENRIAIDLDTKKAEVDAQCAESQYRANEELKTQQYLETLGQEKRRIAQAEMEEESRLEGVREALRRKEALERKETEAQVMMQQTALEAEAKKARAEAEAEVMRTKLKAQQGMDATNLKVLELETNKQVYENMQNLKVVHITGGGGDGEKGGGVASLIPGLAALQQALAASSPPPQGPRKGEE
mmetsp:Transcript_60206/g.123680  ORF Transcript_60206/g.123680 Transcript_60206/m.123680 type:complete len:417 (+) Transcript_60206:247-1497(+)